MAETMISATEDSAPECERQISDSGILTPASKTMTTMGQPKNRAFDGESRYLVKRLGSLGRRPFANPHKTNGKETFRVELMDPNNCIGDRVRCARRKNRD